MSAEKDASYLAFTKHYNGISYKIITDAVISAAFDPNTTDPSSVKTMQTSALWDTGATKTFLSHGIINQLGLVPIGKAIIKHGGGSNETTSYLVNFILPNKVRMIGVPALKITDPDFEHGALIGMDIICRGDFSITNVNNKTCISFRMPSIECIDYVKEYYRIKYSSVRGSHPCPCGKIDANGRRVKFRDCHMAEYNKIMAT
jgi:hypothetical protein